MVYESPGTGRAFLSAPRCGGTHLTVTAYTAEGDEQVMMTSPAPFGPYISLVGFLPTAEGSRILANAAARALNETYRMGLGQSSVVTRRPLLN